MPKDREQLKKEIKQNLLNELQRLNERREQLLKEKNDGLEKLDDQIMDVKLRMEALEKLP